MIKVGVIGCGKWGQNHARVFSKLPCEFVGIADPADTTEGIAKTHHTHWFKNYKDLLDRVDAVSIAVPTTQHFEVAKECIAAGKHVLVEKPLTLSPEQSQNLVAAAKEKNVILSEGYLFRFNPVIEELHDRITRMGKLHYVSSRYVGASKPPRTDSGAVINLAVHFLDILELFFGASYKLHASFSRVLHQEREDSASLNVQYPNGSHATIEVSCCHPEKARDIWIIGENEKYYGNLLVQQLTTFPFQVHPERGVSQILQETVEIERCEPLEKELQHFLTCITEAKRGIPISQITNRGTPNIEMEARLLNLLQEDTSWKSI